MGAAGLVRLGVGQSGWDRSLWIWGLGFGLESWAPWLLSSEASGGERDSSYMTFGLVQVHLCCSLAKT
jgi:hypothetical protein